MDTLLELWYNTEKLVRMRRTELLKILYTNGASDELVERMLTIRKRSMARCKIVCRKCPIQAIQRKKGELILERERLITEINEYYSLLNSE